MATFDGFRWGLDWRTIGNNHRISNIISSNEQLHPRIWKCPSKILQYYPTWGRCGDFEKMLNHWRYFINKHTKWPKFTNKSRVQHLARKQNDKTISNISITSETLARFLPHPWLSDCPFPLLIHSSINQYPTDIEQKNYCPRA